MKELSDKISSRLDKIGVKQYETEVTVKGEGVVQIKLKGCLSLRVVIEIMNLCEKQLEGYYMNNYMLEEDDRWGRIVTVNYMNFI